MRLGPPQHFALLDGLRGYAAFMVLLYHLRHFFHDALPLGSGYLAVDLFFVMSGLVIAMNYEDRLRGMGIAAFARRRFLRLYPVYLTGGLLGLSVALILTVAGAEPLPAGLWAAVPAHLLMLPDIVQRSADGPFPLDPPAWSLFFEIWGNLAYALCVPRMRTGWLAATVGLALVAYVWGSRIAGTVELGTAYAHFGFGAARFWFGFGTGVLIWRLRGRLPRLGWPLVALTMAFPMVPEPLRFVWIVAVMPLGVVAATGLSAPVAACRALGRLSYPLYLLHWPVMVLLTKLMVEAEGGGAWSSPVLGAAIVALSCALTVFVTYRVEPRLHAAFDRLTPCR